MKSSSSEMVCWRWKVVVSNRVIVVACLVLAANNGRGASFIIARRAAVAKAGYGMASYRISDMDGSLEDMSDSASQEEDKIQVVDGDMAEQAMGASIGVGCVFDAFRKCLLKRRGTSKNDPYEYEINEY